MTHETNVNIDHAQLNTRLAVKRTLMSIDQTLMSWLRTALSMITFGFTIYTVLQNFKDKGATLPNEYSPRNVGLFLVGLGTIAMIMGAAEYWGSIKQLQQIERVRFLRPAFIISLCISAMGVMLFVGIVARML